MIVVRGTSLSGIKGDMAWPASAERYTYADYIISHESGWCRPKLRVNYCPVIPTSVTSAGYGLCQPRRH